MQIPNLIPTVIPDERQLEAIRQMGFEKINLHLINKGITPQDVVKMVKNSGLEVKCIHAPYEKENEIMVENIKDNKTIHYAFDTANLVSRNAVIPVVCHTQMGSTVANNPDMLFPVVQAIDDALKSNKNIQLCIENAMPLNSITHSVSQSCLPDYTDVIRVLRSMSKFPDQIFSVLDVCHAHSTIFAVKQRFNNWNMKMKDYFEANINLCRVVHISNSLNYGYSPAVHGIGFDGRFQEEVDKLKTYVSYYYKYIKEALFVLEISEYDYIERENLKTTLETFQKIEEL